MINTYYIVGGGLSLLDYDWSLLRHKNIIAVNRAFEVVPWADFVYFSDFKFFEEYKDKGLFDVDSTFVTVCDKIVHPKVINFKNTGATGLDARHGHLRHGNSSGYAAINLAVQLHANRIILMGFDMQSEMIDVTKISDRTTRKITGRSHWHDGYFTSPNMRTYPKMLKFFHTLVEPLKDLGVEVINANPDSKIEVFPKIPLKEAHLVDLLGAG